MLKMPYIKRLNALSGRGKGSGTLAGINSGDQGTGFLVQVAIKGVLINKFERS